MDWVMILFLLVCIGAWCEAMQRIDEKRKEEKEEDGVYQCVSPFSLRPNAPRLRTRTSS